MRGRVRLDRIVIDRDVVVPDGLVVGEDAELHASRLRCADRFMCLITQQMVDRMATT